VFQGTPTSHSAGTPLNRLGAARRSTFSRKGRRQGRLHPPSGCLFDLGDVDLAHLHHRRHHPAGLGLVRILKQPGQLFRHDLPRDAELVLQPAAWAWLAAVLREPGPEMVDLFLRLAVDRLRHSLGELVLRSTIQRLERHAVELERGHQYLAFKSVALGPTHDAQHPRILEDGGVKVHGLFGLAFEPQAGGDLLHRSLLGVLRLGCLKVGNLQG
jgi:hypothetical protein